VAGETEAGLARITAHLRLCLKQGDDMMHAREYFCVCQIGPCLQARRFVDALAVGY
jgi:hypothetical protein